MLNRNFILPEKKGGTSASLLLLSLFLLLLAFFILLVSVSTFNEDKSVRVLASINNTFSSLNPAPLAREITILSLDEVQTPQAIIDLTQQLWRTTIPVVKVEKVDNGNVLQMHVPVLSLFIGNRPYLRPIRTDLLESTMRALSTPLEGAEIRLEITLFVDEFTDMEQLSRLLEEQTFYKDEKKPQAGYLLPGTAAESLDLPQRENIYKTSDYTHSPTLETFILSRERIKTLAQIFQTNKSAARRVRFSLNQGNTKYIRLRFFILDANNAYLTFAPQKNNNDDGE